jgi:hypothetical protein
LDAFSGKTNELKSAGFSTLDRIEPQSVAHLVPLTSNINSLVKKLFGLFGIYI